MTDCEVNIYSTRKQEICEVFIKYQKENSLSNSELADCLEISEIMLKRIIQNNTDGMLSLSTLVGLVHRISRK